jgi:putative alpha-1,2-mannosidase
MFPGVTRPFGVVKLGPDLYTGVDAYSGYLPTGRVTGYTMMHESGTGGAPKYGVVAQMPILGNISNPLLDFSVNRAAADNGTVGYYSSSLANGIKTELAASEHAAMFQYTFPTGQQGNILVDVSHVLSSYRGQGLGQGYSNGNISLFPDGHYEGSGVYNNGWNRCKLK